MEGAFSWIGNLADWIAQWIPRWILVHPTHGAIKCVTLRIRDLGRGRWDPSVKVIPLGPGFHLFWPVATEFHSYPTARQATDLRPQALVTSDDKAILVGGLIVYEIKDIEAILARTFDPDDTIKDVSLSAIHDVCCQKTWEQLKEEQRSGALDRELKREAKRELDKYGVLVLKMTLTDLAPCRVLKLVNSASPGVGL